MLDMQRETDRIGELTYRLEREWNLEQGWDKRICMSYVAEIGYIQRILERMVMERDARRNSDSG